MYKEIHWLLKSLNDRMHEVDKLEKDIFHMRDLQEEIHMWRSKYAEDQAYTKDEKDQFCNLPTQNFISRTPLQVFREFVKTYHGIKFL